MSEHSRPCAIHSNQECERLELQARLANIEGHLRYLPVAPGDRVLDAGCGSGSMSRLIAPTFPRADVIGVDLREQYLVLRGAVCARKTSEILYSARLMYLLFRSPMQLFDVVWTKYLLQWLKEPARAQRATAGNTTRRNCRFLRFRRLCN